MNKLKPEKKLAELLKVLGSSPRIQLLQAIGRVEVCVCHLEAIFPDWRQAYISQHLMALRQANLLTSRREGRYIFYRLKDQKVLSLLNDAASLVGGPLTQFTIMENCDCPSCQILSPEMLA